MNTKIDYKDFSSLLFFLSQEMFLGVGFTHILNSSKQDTWVSILIGTFLGFIFLFLIFKYMDYEKDLNFFQKNKKIFGNTIGNIINTFFFLLFVLYFIFTSYSLSLYIQNKYLGNTPSIFIIILFLLPILFILNFDLKTLTKVSMLSFILVVTIYTLSIFGLVNFIDINNFKPIFNTKTASILNSSLYFISYLLTPLILISIIPKNKINYPKKVNKTLTIFYILICLSLFTVFSLIISVFGIDYAKLFYYPEFTLLKKINYFNFIEHVENLLSSQWLFSFFFNASMCVFFFKEYFNSINLNIVKNKNYYIYLIILINLYFSPKLFKNTTQGYSFVSNNFFIIYSIPILLFLILTLFIIKFRKNKE